MKFRQFLALSAAVTIAAASIFSGCGEKKGNNVQNSVASEISSAAESVPEKSAEESKDQSFAAESSVNSQTSQESESSNAVSDSSAASKAESSTEESSAESSIAQTSNSNENTITPKVWEAKNQNGDIVYMMGTIHLGDEEVMNMPDYFESTFAKCDALAVECDTSKSDLDLTSIIGFVYTDGSTIKDHVKEDDYKKAVEILSGSSYYNSVYNYVKPIMWLSLAEIEAASRVGLTDKYGVDSILISRAYKENKSVLEVEGSAFQTKVISSISDEIQEMLFHEMAITDNYIEEMVKEMDELYNDWKSGNEVESDDELDSETSITEEQQKMIDEYNKIMLHDRNKGMVDKIESYIKEGKKVFFAVGAAHFYGEKGIIKLLENKGYTVRALTSEDAEEIPAASSSEESSEIIRTETDPAIPRAA